MGRKDRDDDGESVVHSRELGSRESVPAFFMDESVLP
jgi:hypothetical protein